MERGGLPSPLASAGGRGWAWSWGGRGLGPGRAPPQPLNLTLRWTPVCDAPAAVHRSPNHARFRTDAASSSSNTTLSPEEDGTAECTSGHQCCVLITPNVRFLLQVTQMLVWLYAGL